MLMAAFTFSAGVNAQEPTDQERERAIRLLNGARHQVNASVSGLSDAQWTFKPAPDRWSVVEIVEHIALINGIVQGLFLNIDHAPAPPQDRNAKEFDEMILTRLADRSQRFKGPESARPTGRWTPPEALEQFRATSNDFADLVRTSNGLRQHAVPHPLFGPMDGYQWVLAVAGHGERHNQQILEVKADAHFPEK